MREFATTLPEMFRSYWPVFVCSFVVSLVATPLCRWIALRRRIVDQPDDFLKPHARPVPYLGGVAIYLGWAAGIGLAFVLFDQAAEETEAPRLGPTLDLAMVGGVLIAGTAVMLLGLFDDLRSVSAKTKLVGLSLVTALLIATGLGGDSILILFRSTGVRLLDMHAWVILLYSIPFTLLITLGACNATNLIDGLDGLCSGVLGIISAGFLVLAVNLHLWYDWDPLDVQRVTLSLAMMGASLGFLPFNRNPAKIFMGDAGSMLLGLNVAVLMLLFSKSSAMRWMLASIMVFGLPLADMTLTLVRRWRNEKPVMQGDRSHFYDQLVDRGWPVKRVVRVSYALAAFFVLMGCVSITVRTRYIIPLYALVVAGVVWLVIKYGMVRLESKSRIDGNDDRALPQNEENAP